MRIEVEAELILQVPQPKRDEKASDVVLAAEQFVNSLQGFNRAETGTAVGVRIHTKDFKVIK